jgi:hypothetical protein
MSLWENYIKKFSLISATVLGAWCFGPRSVKWSADKNLSVSQDKAFAVG